MSLTFENFDLHITQDEQIEATSEREGDAGPVRLQYDPNVLKLAQQVVELEGADPELVRELGIQLYRTLFPTPIQRIYDRSRDPGRRLRLRLRIEPKWLAGLPWELLYDDQEKKFLSLTKDISIIRDPRVSQPIQSLQIKGPLRILVVIASPANYPDLNRESQANELKKVLSGVQARGILEVDFLLHATYAGLISRLRDNEFHILHYLGYSAFDAGTQQPVLLFERENGLARKVSGEKLGELLYREDLGRVTKENVRALRLVLINDCEIPNGATENYSVGVATSLVQSGIPAALAMQYGLPETATWKFVVEFYRAIASGEPIDTAVTKGRAAIKDEIKAGDEDPAPDEAVPGEWGAPVLFMRAKDGQLFRPQQIQQLTAARSTEQVYTEIDKFKVEIRDRPTRFFLDYLWAFILPSAVGIFVYWFTSRQLDVLLISAVGVAFSCVWLLRSLFREKVPNTLDKLWRRRLIAAKTSIEEKSEKGWFHKSLAAFRGVSRQKTAATPLVEEYLEFLRRYNDRLNDKCSWITRALTVGIAVYSLLNLNFDPIPPPWRLPLQLLIFVLAPLMGYVLGTLLWKMIATIITTYQLSYCFGLDVRPNHPDKCGGLKPLGDLYFANAWIVLLAGLFVAAWVLILSLSNAIVEGTSNLEPTLLVNLAWRFMGYYRWLRLYSIILVILALVAIITFIFPMYNTCRIMQDKKPRFRRKADSLAGEIAELERHVEKFGTRNNEESTEISHRLEWLEERYQKYDNPPRWPFDARVKFRMAGSLTTMALSFVASRIPSIIGRFLRSDF